MVQSFFEFTLRYFFILSPFPPMFILVFLLLCHGWGHVISVMVKIVPTSLNPITLESHGDYCYDTPHSTTQ